MMSEANEEQRRVDGALNGEHACPLTSEQAKILMNDVKEIKQVLLVSRWVFRTVIAIVVGVAVVIDWFAGHSSFFRDSINTWLGANK